MVQCDYCCSRPSCLKIDCSQCYSDRTFNLCLKCSSNVHLFSQHWKDHSNAQYKFEDVPLNENNCSSWLSIDELNLIETIETCGLGNWFDIGQKVHRKSSSCEKHFEDIYLSPHQSSYSISFQRILSKKLLHGEIKFDSNQQKDFQSESIIYPLMLISNDQQKCYTYMPYRDEYEREFENNSEYYLPTQIQIDQDETNVLFDEQSNLIDQSKILLQQSKLILCRSYSHRIRKRFQLKHFIRDYALAFAFSNDQKFDLHQISRFLSSDQYERLIYNHRKIDQIIDEFGCSSSSTSTRNSSTRTNLRQRSSNSIRSNSIKSQRSKKIGSNISLKSTKRENLDDEEESQTCQSTLSSTSTEQQNIQLNSNSNSNSNKTRRRSIRRVSSSSSSSSSRSSSRSSSSMSISDELTSSCSSRLTKDSSSIDEQNRRRSIYPSDLHNSNDKSSRFVQQTNLFTSSNSESNSTEDVLSSSNQLDSNDDDESLFISSRTRSHPSSSSRHQTKNCSLKYSSMNGEKSLKERNGSTNSTKIKRKRKSKKTNKLNKKILNEKNRSTNKRKRVLSNSFDD